jgi:predicted anti-sigma-YlaC factor YlaD
MNCEKAQKWISLDRDGELSPRRMDRLHAHLDTCSMCRKVRNEWESVGVQMRKRHVPVMQSPEAMWVDVRRAIRQDQEEREETERAWVLGAPWRWAAMTLLVMILSCGLFIHFQKRTMRGGATQVEFVETGLPDATPMVYEDAESGWTVIWIVEANGKEGGHAGS